MKNLKRELSTSLSKMKFMNKTPENAIMSDSNTEQSHDYILENKTRLKRDASFTSKDFVNGRMLFKKSRDSSKTSD